MEFRGQTETDGRLGASWHRASRPSVVAAELRGAPHGARPPVRVHREPRRRGGPLGLGVSLGFVAAALVAGIVDVVVVKARGTEATV